MSLRIRNREWHKHYHIISLDAGCDTETAVDGIIWKKLEVGGSTGKPPIHAIFKDTEGLTGYAKRNVIWVV